MRFRIKCENREELKKFLDEFMSECEEEYRKQRSSGLFKSIPLPEFAQTYADEGDYVILRNSFAMPFVLRGRVGGKMEKNLKGFLESKGLKVEVKFIGD